MLCYEEGERNAFKIPNTWKRMKAVATPNPGAWGPDPGSQMGGGWLVPKEDLKAGMGTPGGGESA